MDLKLPSPTKSPVKRSSASPTKSSSPSKSALPDPNLRLHNNSICAKDTKLSLTHGTLTLRSNSIIHPKVQVTTGTDGLVLGRCSIISERCVIEETTRIGDYVLVEAGCNIAAREIGDDCVIESAVVLEKGCVIGINCRVCAGETVRADQVVPDNTVIFGSGRRRRENGDQVRSLFDVLTRRNHDEKRWKSNARGLMRIWARQTKYGERDEMLVLDTYSYIFTLTNVTPNAQTLVYHQV